MVRRGSVDSGTSGTWRGRAGQGRARWKATSPQWLLMSSPGFLAIGCVKMTLRTSEEAGTRYRAIAEDSAAGWGWCSCSFIPGIAYCRRPGRVSQLSAVGARRKSRPSPIRGVTTDLSVLALAMRGILGLATRQKRKEPACQSQTHNLRLR